MTTAREARIRAASEALDRTLIPFGDGYGNAGGTEHWSAAMGIDWMTNDELCEAIPPSYTEHVGAQLLEAVERAA